jgi:hypothetical protein
VDQRWLRLLPEATVKIAVKLQVEDGDQRLNQTCVICVYKS